MPSRVAGLLALLFLASFVFTRTCHAEEPSGDLVKTTLVADVDAISPGQSFWLGVRFAIKPHWHIYWKNPGEAGDATRVKLSAQGLEFGPVQFPLPTKIQADGGVTYGYEQELMLLVPVKVSKELPPTGEIRIAAHLTWQSCKDTCVDGEAKPTLSMNVRGQAAPANKELFEAWRKRLPVSGDELAKTVGKVQQEKQDDGTPLPMVTVDWSQPPAGKVDWFPVSTEAVAIENVVVTHQGSRTTIRFKPTVYKPQEVPEGRVEGLLLFEDSSGQRRGIELPVNVKR